VQKTLPLTLALALLGARAPAQELDTILPDTIPGYGTQFGVTAPGHLPRPETTGLQWGGITIAPSLATAAGYDSAPNGAAASSLLNLTPSLTLADPILGFGAYAAANASLYPEDRAQNTSGTVLAMGERAVLPRETITLSAGDLRAQTTGFALDTISITRPIAFSVLDFRAGDKISAGLFALEPQFSNTSYRFPGYAAQNRTDNRETLNLSVIPGGPTEILLRLRATQSSYRTPLFNAHTNQALAGLNHTANGIWTFSALAGAAQRQPRYGKTLIAPVLEARLDWMPTGLDRLRLTLAREIDDPDEISATPYTISQAQLSVVHEYSRTVTIKLAEAIANAAYFDSPDYNFNDRQANYLRAANEHVATLGLTWTP
jgi:Putative beta-barrel porin 2